MHTHGRLYLRRRPPAPPTPRAPDPIRRRLALLFRRRRARPGGLYPCAVCGKVFITRRGRVWHARRQHHD